jgi:hypothetical protein
VLPSATQILAQLQSDEPLPGILSNDAAFDTLARIIALQLLAACHTFLPASSASPIPLFQQRKGPRPVTALRLHSQYRFSPAAGHQARAPSESASWPGLHIGPSVEDRLAERISHQRRLEKRSSEWVPHFAATEWTDGPPPIRVQRVSLSRASSSSPEPGFFSRLICQASIPKNPRRKHNTMFLSRITSRPKRPKQSQSESNQNYHSAQPVQRIPSLYRLRNTQSAPRIEDEDVSMTSPHNHDGKRYGSDPSIGSPLNYPFRIPEIRHSADTSSPNWIPGNLVAGELRACGRGDLIAAQDYFHEMPETPATDGLSLHPSLQALLLLLHPPLPPRQHPQRQLTKAAKKWQVTILTSATPTSISRIKQTIPTPRSENTVTLVLKFKMILDYSACWRAS